MPRPDALTAAAGTGGAAAAAVHAGLEDLVVPAAVPIAEDDGGQNVRIRGSLLDVAGVAGRRS